MESTSPTTAVAAPASSAMPTASVPSSASQPAMSAPSSYQAAPQAPVAPSAASPGLPANGGPAGFGSQSMAAGVSGTERKPEYAASIPGPGVVLGLSDSDATGQYPGAVGFSAPGMGPAGSADLRSPSFNPGLFGPGSAGAAGAPGAADPQPSKPNAASGPDSYLSQISDVSLEVLEHFGAEAPALLNNYACAVEDALIEQVGRNQSMNVMLDAAGEERATMNLMLTDPDILADYVNGFFGPEGPYPTETAEETAQREAYEARAQFEAEIEAQEQRGVPQSFQRPEMDMPTPGRQSSGARSFWGDFSSMMDNNPEQAWQFLSGAPQQAFQQKMLVQDY